MGSYSVGCDVAMSGCCEAVEKVLHADKCHNYACSLGNYTYLCSVMRIFRGYNSVVGNIVIVLLFALLHSAVAIISRALDYYDDIPLTILTITMVIVVCMRNNTRVEIMAMLALLATLLGFLVGGWLWRPLYVLIGNMGMASAISTFVITMVFGLGVNYTTQNIKRFVSETASWKISTRNTLLVALFILVLRMAYIVLFRSEGDYDPYDNTTLMHNIIDILSNTWALLVILMGNIILSLRIRHRRSEGYSYRAVVVLYFLVITVVSSLFAYFNIPHYNGHSYDNVEFFRLASAVLLLNLLTFVACYVVQVLLSSKRELRYEREQKHRAEYQYDRLKQQINPHFLFNSLGILDYLVQEHETERASIFIRKLANIYRYMLNNDQQPLVKLTEELDFAKMYIDLLQVRFVDGLVINIDIDEQLMGRYVVPCSLQLLVENATKHNVVSADTPLTLDIVSEGDVLIVRNNLQLRRHGQPSTRVGLANISRQYQDITRRNIEVLQTEKEFIVKLPIV